MFDRRLIQNFDWVLLLLLLFIAAISIVNLYSATLRFEMQEERRSLQNRFTGF